MDNHRKLTPDERARLARVARRLIAKEIATRDAKCRDYRTLYHWLDYCLSALAAEIDEHNATLARMRRAVHRLEFVPPADDEDWRAAA